MDEVGQCRKMTSVDGPLDLPHGDLLGVVLPVEAKFVELSLEFMGKGEEVGVEEGGEVASRGGFSHSRMVLVLLGATKVAAHPGCRREALCGMQCLPPRPLWRILRWSERCFEGYLDFSSD